MKTRFFSRMACVAALATVALSAHATTSDTVIGASFVNGSTSFTQSFADGLSATFVAGQRTFEKKTQAGLTGVGIAGGRTGGEIDIGETITGSFSKGVSVSAITLGLLFDGPEYKDVNEVARLTGQQL